MERPNILWIVTTQWRAQALGSAGDPNARTPRLDALAAESVNFTQAVTPHPMGPMARAALLTGVASPENGVRDYFDPLPAEARTIAHELRERGYATAFFGKWGVGKRDPALPLVSEAAARVIVPKGERGGFKFFVGFEGGFQLNDPWLHGTRLAVPVRLAGYQSDVLCTRAAEWMREQNVPALTRRATKEASVARRVGGGSQPCFCVVNLEAPHPPYDALAAGVAARDAREIVLPANVPHGSEAEVKARRELAGYYAHIEATDRAVGRLVAAVTGRQKENEQRNENTGETIVVFTSVHGDMHGAHGLFRKGWPHEESVRVPLLVRLARGERNEKREGRRDKRAVSLLDLPAMTLAWADGETWAPRGEVARISMPSVVALPHQCDRAWRGVRTRSRKLALNTDGSPWLYFDLERDPLERENLVGDPARAAEIAELARRV